MKKTLDGIVKFRDIGMGCWEFLTGDGQSFELIGGDDSVYEDGKKAKLRGKIRTDLMSAGNIGPIFEIDSSE